MKLMKVFTTIRNNWKKSLFFSGVLTYGGFYIVDKIKIYELMKLNCSEAAKYGQETIHPFQKLRHITVIINPVSNSNKCVKNYEKYVAPIFHCAGIKVSLVQTETEGQAKDLMEIMDNTDSVVIAGGSGTLQEALTGFLRRNDSEVYTKKISLGLLPLGKTNHFTNSLFNFDKYKSEYGKSYAKVKILVDSAMSVVKETKKNVDIIEITGRNRSVYAFESIHLGLLRDALVKGDSYWYLTSSMKPYFALFRNVILKSHSKIYNSYDFKINYTEPCSGCSKCNHLYIQKNTDDGNKRWWHSFLPKKPVLNSPRVDFSHIENNDCGLFKDIIIPPEDKMIDIFISNSIDKGYLNLIYSLSSNEKTNLFMKGININKRKLDHKIFDILKVQNLNIEYLNDKMVNETENNVNLSDNINIASDQNKNTDDDSNKKNEKNDVESNDKKNIPFFNIDSEHYELQSLKIKLLPKKVSVYIPA